MNNVKPVRFGKYLLLDKIGTGGMAETYRAKIIADKGFEKLIAVKKIHPHLSSQEDVTASFIDEAKLAAHLHHPNIVQTYDFGKMQDAFFISMEYLFGKDLSYVTKQADQSNLPLPLDLTLYIISRVCEALDYAHNLKGLYGDPLNIIHRDITPHNIFITYEGQVKIIDFGIAKAATKSSQTQTGFVKGKVAYMSPEQARGAKIDHRSDLFSLSLVLYEIVTGKRMFIGDNTLEILKKVQNFEYKHTEEIVSGVNPEVSKILKRALSKDPDDRHQFAGQMLADIEQCMHRLSLNPSPKTLANYMKTLFEDEIPNEERTLSNILKVAADLTQTDMQNTDREENNNDTTITTPSDENIKTSLLKLSDMKLPQAVVNLFQNKKAVLYTISAMAIILLSIMLGSWIFSPKSHEAEMQKAANNKTSVIERQPENDQNSDTASAVKKETQNIYEAETVSEPPNTNKNAPPEPVEQEVVVEHLARVDLASEAASEGEADVESETEADAQQETENEREPEPSAALEAEPEQAAPESEPAEEREIYIEQELEPESASEGEPEIEREAAREVDAEGEPEIEREQEPEPKVVREIDVKTARIVKPKIKIEPTITPQPTPKTSTSAKPVSVKSDTINQKIPPQQQPASKTTAAASKTAAAAVELKQKPPVKTEPTGKTEPLVRTDDELIEKHYKLAALYLEKKSYDKTIKEYEKVLEINPNHQKALFNLGYVYMTTNDYNHSSKTYHRLISLKPAFLDEVYVNLAIVNFKQKQYNESLDNLKKALSHNPQNPKAKKYYEDISKKAGEKSQ
ncbi:serine/threonine protein kinase [Candidatus Magnetoovum chiemensis]|nr:serine/threonine protein kinase [Candidatus Magnetoovum chiemensis]